MTDFPAVIYLKAETSNVEQINCERHDDKTKTNHTTKKLRNCKNFIRRKNQIKSYKKLLETMNNAISKKMNKVEESLETLSQNSDKLESKIDTLSSLFDSSSYNYDVILNKFTESFPKHNQIVPFFSKITQIDLNTKGDFPDGSWLGFQNNPEMRVRCKITARNLHQINKNCTTPIKMALTLLDNLFDRETQASSNISGLGKHKKKQLDPLLIYGIRCHLMYRFAITEDDWTKIKIHMDSKCRTAFRRKRKGMSIAPKAQLSS